jgi:hypothetical protein
MCKRRTLNQNGRRRNICDLKLLEVQEKDMLEKIGACSHYMREYEGKKNALETSEFRKTFEIYKR